MEKNPIFRSVIWFAAVGILMSPYSRAASSWSSDKPSWAVSPTPYSSYSPQSEDRKAREAALSPMAPNSHNVSLGVGQVFLMGDLGEGREDNIGGRINYTYGVSDIFGFNVGLGHSSHSGGKLTLTTLQAGVRINLSWYDRIIPYMHTGLGFYRPSFELTKTQSESPVLFGFHLGPGVDLALTNRFFFGTGITFHDMFGGKRIVAVKEMDEDAEVDVGGTFTTFFVHTGMTF